MEQRRQIPRLFSWIFLAFTLLSVILRTVCMLFFFDADVGYLATGPLPTVSNACYFVAVAAAIVCAALTPKGLLPTELNTPNRPFAAVLVGSLLALFTVAALFFPGLFPDAPGKAALAANVLGLLASIYFFCSAPRNGRYPDWLSLLGFLPVIWCIAAVANTYFDAYVTMNSPVKIALHLGLLGFMLIMLAELRFRVGKALPRYAVAFFAMGSYACLMGSIPLLAATLQKTVIMPRYALYALVLLGAGFYGFYLLIRYATAPVETPDGEAASPETDNMQAQ